MPSALRLPAHLSDLQVRNKVIAPWDDSISTTILFHMAPDAPFDEPFREDGIFKLISKEPLKYENGKAVLRVELAHEQDGGRHPLTAVCKFAWGTSIEELEREVQCYQDLKTLQGEHIPQFYGCFEGQMDDGMQMMCIVISYFEGQCVADMQKDYCVFNKSTRYFTPINDYLCAITN